MRPASATGLFCAAILVTAMGCDDMENGVAGTEQEPETPPAEDTDNDDANANGMAEAVTVSETFTAYEEDATAITYDEEGVPEGAEVELDATPTDGATEFHLAVTGLAADEEFGAHLHTDPCGPEPEDSGPHYQDEEDPDFDPQSDEISTDPEYANPDNEVWLDFTTDGDGNAEADTTVDWEVRTGEASSLVLHEEHTQTEEGEAGEAGDRLACVNAEL